MLQLSTGLRNALLSGGSLKGQLDGGLIKIYSGTPPASPDEAIGGGNTLLCTVSNNGGGTGINFDAAASGGVLAKAPAETWKGTNAATGTASFYRHVAAGDDGTQSTTQKRIQGTIGVAGADMNLSSVALVAAAEQKIDFYSLTMPTSPVA